MVRVRVGFRWNVEDIEDIEDIWPLQVLRRASRHVASLGNTNISRVRVLGLRLTVYGLGVRGCFRA